MIGDAPGKYPARVVLSMVAATARKPARSASASVSPVRPTSVLQILVTARAHDAGEGGVAAADVDAGHPALAVGHGAERRRAPVAG